MEALSNSLVIWICFSYLISIICYLCYWNLKIHFLGFLATILTWLTLIALTVSIILRWIASYQLNYSHAPFSNLFESLIFFSWTLTLLYLILEWKTSLRQLSLFALPLPFFSLLYALTNESSIQPLMPALKSHWLIIHVATCFIGYASFGISFALSIMYLAVGSIAITQKRQNIILDEFIYQTVVIGFIFLTFGIVTGSIWANSAWSTYWAWDPKETWSLITWLIYAALLHSRFMRGWQGRRIAIFSIVGFVCVLFTYFGVNYLGGLHAYANR